MYVKIDKKQRERQVKLIHEFLDYYCKKNKITRTEIGRKFGLSKQLFHSILKGKTSLNTEIADKLVKLSQGRLKKIDLFPKFYPEKEIKTAARALGKAGKK